MLLRDGVEVAAVTRPVITSSVGHTSWIDLTLHKRGAVVEFWVHGERILTYTDPAPLAGGVPAIWTSDNGLAVARARLAFAAPPVTRTEPQVLLDDPWSPEWMNVGAPLTLDFPRACSTTGAPVILRVTPHTPIASAAGTATVEDSRVIFTPRGAGDFWFQVAATDGTTRSPAFNLALRAFDPARGRDDSHAVALYRFTEGSGQTVRDQSTANPPIDLTFPAQAPARWLPGQGLQLTGPCALTSGRGVSRLAPALTKATAGTFEFWVSLETIFPPVDWAGCLLAWQHSNTRRNLAIANMREYLVLTRAATFTPRADTVTAFSSIRTGLQHLVITWNGTTTSCYVNGQLLGQAPYAWTPARWFHDAPLILGNVSAIPRCDPDETSRFLHNASYILKEQHGKDYSFLGTYYLVAIHDRCLPPAQVQRHYEVGPGAK